ncbi:MAG: phage tail tube protein, partial [Flammeovirgaceae bacterium]
LNQTDLASFTLQYSKGEIGNKRVKGGAIKSLELDFSDKDCVVKVEFMGLAEEAGDSQTVVITKPTRYLLSKLLTSKWATTVAGLSSGTEVKIKSLNIKIDTGLEADKAMGSVNPIDMLAGTAKVEFS